MYLLMYHVCFNVSIDYLHSGLSDREGNMYVENWLPPPFFTNHD